MYPFAVGATAPNIGVPLGKRLRGGTTVCGDPVNWFVRAGLLPQPSFAVLGRPGMGKSSLVRRIAIGLAPTATPLVLGDLKAEYVDVVRALGGQVVTLGRGAGALNVLDAGAMDQAASRLGGMAGSSLREEGHARRTNALRALLAIVRGRPTEDHEDIALNAALRLLMKRWTRRKSPPLVPDLIKLINEAPDEVRLVTLDRGDESRYRDTVDPLVRSLMAICDGPLGDMFARQTTERLRLDVPAVCIDISSIHDNDRQLQAGALLACWNEGFGTVEANNALADAGIIPQRWFLVIVDELWQVMQAGAGLVDRVNALTRLNRDKGVAQILITHSGRDMPLGFLERSGAVACFGLPRRELDQLDEIVQFTEEERNSIASWSTPPGWSPSAQAPGLGKVLLKVGEKPGVPVQIEFVPAEMGLHQTSKRWTT